MTPAQRKVYDEIASYIMLYGHSPAHHEIGEALGLNTSTITRCIERLVEAGYITSIPGAARTLRIVREP
jgi:DNA-binding MarR family transcriptional regulator